MTRTHSIVVWLLIEDPSQLQATSEVLLSAGWQTRPFADSDAFLKYARVCSPEVAILDFGGAHARGLQIRARLRDVSPKTWTVIALKPHHDPAHRLVSKNELVDLIKQYVEASQKRFIPKQFSTTRRNVAVGSRA